MPRKEIDADTPFYEFNFTFALDKELFESDDVEKDGVHNLMTEIHMKVGDYLDSLGIIVIEGRSSGNRLKEKPSEEWFYDGSEEPAV
jgi:hypothetical protein